MSFEFQTGSFISPKDTAKKNAKLMMYQWAYTVLSNTGIDFEDSIPEDGDPESLSIIQKAKMRKILEINKIFILDNKDETLEIYLQNELIGKWEAPYYKLCYDPSQINPKDKYYMDVEIVFGSVFDNKEDYE